jgi:hypothetical protein
MTAGVVVHVTTNLTPPGVSDSPTRARAVVAGQVAALGVDVDPVAARRQTRA